MVARFSTEADFVHEERAYTMVFLNKDLILNQIQNLLFLCIKRTAGVCECKKN